VFDRVTGQPIWPIEEQPVPASNVPGESASKMQPFPTKPAPIDIQGVRDQDLIDLTPELHKEAIDIVAPYDHGPLFTPPSQRGAIQVPGVAGGANWSEIALPANAAGAPITYMAGGKQFIAFPVGGGPLVEELIAVSL
jgi:quinoprotein glucose dehydrogenase